MRGEPEGTKSVIAAQEVALTLGIGFYDEGSFSVRNAPANIQVTKEWLTGEQFP